MLIVPGTHYTSRHTPVRTNDIGAGFHQGADTVIVHYPASAWPYTGINGPYRQRVNPESGCHTGGLGQPAAHSLACSSSSRPNSLSSPGTIHAKACSA